MTDPIYHVDMAADPSWQAYTKLSSPRRPKTIDNIIIHHTGGSQILPDMVHGQMNRKDGSYHYIIGLTSNGVDWAVPQIWYGVRENRISWGALNDRHVRADRTALNIAVCMNTLHGPIPEPSMKLLTYLVANRCAHHQIDLERVLSHRDHAPLTKPFDDPGVAQLLERINAYNDPDLPWSRASVSHGFSAPHTQ